MSGIELGMAATILLLDGGGDPTTKLCRSGRRRHLFYISADDGGGIASVAHPPRQTAIGLACAAVDDGDEVSGDDDCVLWFLFRVFAYYLLFYDFHTCCCSTILR